MEYKDYLKLREDIKIDTTGNPAVDQVMLAIEYHYKIGKNIKEIHLRDNFFEMWKAYIQTFTYKLSSENDTLPDFNNEEIEFDYNGIILKKSPIEIAQPYIIFLNEYI